MSANLIYISGIIFIAIGTILTYWGSSLKSEEGTEKLEIAITKKDSLIENLNYQITDLRAEQENLILLQEEPILKILPESDIKGDQGVFKLKLYNKSLGEVTNIEIYEDYFVALGNKGSPVNLYRFGMFSVKPNSYFPSIPKNDTLNFTIDYSNLKEDMNEFYLDDSRKGQRMMVAKIKLNYTRKIDGKIFSQVKVFIIAANDYLIDYDSSRDLKTDFHSYTFDEVKEILGATF